MMRTVYLHGRLGAQYGDSFRFDVETAGEALRALNVNLPGFIESLREGSYELVRGDLDEESGMWLELNHINGFRLGASDLHIVPANEGSSKRGGAIKTILGVALIGAAVFFSGGTLAAPLASSGILSGMTYGNLAMLGVALTLAGVSDLMAPKTKPTGNQGSFAFSGPGNTYDQGNPVPLVYGEMICGSQLVSAGLDVDPIPVGWDPTVGNVVIDTNDPENGQGTTWTNNTFTYTGPAQTRN